MCKIIKSIQITCSVGNLDFQTTLWFDRVTEKLRGFNEFIQYMKVRKMTAASVVEKQRTTEGGTLHTV